MKEDINMLESHKIFRGGVCEKGGTDDKGLFLVVEQPGNHPLKGKRFEAPPPRI
jgi:hypothetical protein